VLDGRLQVRTRLDTPDLSFASSAPVVLPYRQGIWWFGPDWSFVAWSDEP
jgi:hypothetical protein